MTKVRYAIPGIGGSLGECPVCGKSFAVEMILGKSIKTLKISTCEAELPVHEKCGELVVEISNSDKDWKRLPEGSLRSAFEEAEKEMEEGKAS